MSLQILWKANRECCDLGKRPVTHPHTPEWWGSYMWIPEKASALAISYFHLKIK